MTTIRRMNKKQELELFYVKPILQSLGVEVYTSADRPDLRFSYRGRSIGAEVVLCFPDDNGQYEQLANRAYMACKEYAKKLKYAGIKGIHASISFTDQAYSFEDKVTNRVFYDRVLSEIDIKLKQQEYEARYSLRDAFSEYDQMMINGAFDCKYVDGVRIYHLQDLEIIDVTPSRTGYVLPVSSEEVLSLIRKKEGKLIGYKSIPDNHTIEEYWLFISVPGDTFQDLDDFVMPPFETKYDSVFINRFNSVLRLK